MRRESYNITMVPAVVRAVFGGAAVVAVVVVVVSGCTLIEPVQPWQRGYLAKSTMSFSPDPLEARLSQHIHTSREAASGGYGIGGGGCGCN